MTTIVGLFKTHADLVHAIDGLRRLGIPDGDISVVARNGASHDSAANEAEAEAGAAADAVGAGAALGGATGLLVGLGALAIPGIGPVLAIGPLATALSGAAIGAGVGAAAGGLVGSLGEMDISHEEARFYEAGVRQGGALLTAEVDEAIADEARAALRRANMVEPQGRAIPWDNEPGNYTPDADAEQRRYHDPAQEPTGGVVGTEAAPVGAEKGVVPGEVGPVGVGPGVGDLSESGPIDEERPPDEIERRRRAYDPNP